MNEPLVGSVNAAGGKVVVAKRIDRLYMNAAPPPIDYVLDFSSLISSATAGFVGREAVFAALDTFVQQRQGGYFEIVADAGLGKTAVAAEITRRRKAIAFFASASRGRTRPEQFLTHVCGELITRYALDHDHLPGRPGEDTSFLERLLREAVAGRKGAPMFIVVDALDEADEAPPGSNPLLLPPELPEPVYVVVTRRSGRDLITLPNTPTERYTIRRDDPQQGDDIEAYLTTEATRNKRIARALAEAEPPVPAEVFVERLKNASDGNFMYVSYLITDIAARQPGENPLALDDLPKGLPGYYEQFWSRMEAVVGEDWAVWDGLYRPTIERLGVAGEAVTPDWISAQIGRPAKEIRERALQRWERLLSHERRNGQETWRVVHRSFADFLAGKVDLRAAHIAVAQHYCVALRDDVAAWDDYGLHFTATHLAEGARQSGQPERHALVELVTGLVTDPGFQDAHLGRFGDPTLLERDLVMATRVVAEDDDAARPPLAVESALQLMSFRREQRKPQPIFDLANRGEVEAASRRLDLFALEVDRDWYDAILLTIAWLAFPLRPEAARRQSATIRKEHPASPTLALLQQRVDAAFGDAPLPDVQLPSPPPQDVAIAIVERLGGAQGESFLQSEFQQSELASDLRSHTEEFVGTSGYLAQYDGPYLVAAAVESPAFGEPLLRQYLAIHSAYGYRQYRQGSLWALLDAILHHPSQEWVRAWVPALAEAVLAPNRGEFAEGLGLAALLVRAEAGDAASLAELERRRDQTLAEVEALQYTKTRRGAGDTWGSHKRRLAALAEVFAQVPAGPVASPTAALLSAALRLRYGFAGFHAPACLALAEAIEVAGADRAWADTALAAGLDSAHNIQDATFCARTTARINAMRERWWVSSATLDVGSAAQQLLREPSSAAYSALHVVGEAYAGREQADTTPLPPELREARSLEALADAYERPLVDFLRLNAGSGWEPDQSLADGVRVNVPDPGFPPLIAARLAARALVDGHLSDLQRIATICALVPVAADEPTALYTVLARLILAWHPSGPDTVARMSDMVASFTEQEMPDAELAARLTTFIP